MLKRAWAWLLRALGLRKQDTQRPSDSERPKDIYPLW
jgi:hypothetical protein